jgi:hypothetical protein
LAFAGPEIYVPEFPPGTRWLNAPFVRVSTLLGRAVSLVWFWDCASLNSLRALPYVREWHRRYSQAGLRVIGVHSPQFDFGAKPEIVERALARLEIEFPVALDSSFETWRLYGNEVWPALYQWDRRGVLRHHHFGEGGYEETERAIQELLREIDETVKLPEPMTPLRETDRPDALVQVPTPHVYLEDDRSAREVRAGDSLCIRYSGAEAAAVIDGVGGAELELDGEPLRELRFDGPGLYTLVRSERHEQHGLRLRFRNAARVYAFSFAPGPA